MNQVVIKSKVVGVDIGIDTTTFAIVDVRGNIIAEDGFMTTDYPDIASFIDRLSEGILTLVEANGGYETIRSVGISSPSANSRTYTLENASNLPWKGIVPLAAMLRDRLGLAVALVNNAHATALSEHVYGNAHGMKDFILITLGYGLGSCIVSNGQVHLGADGFAGEVGHTSFRYGGRLCGCGKRGCLEAYTASKGIVKTAEKLLKETDEPSLMRNAERLTPSVISRMCDEGDKLAIEVYRRTGDILGAGLASYASVLNPEAIIFTGGISRAGKWLLEPAWESFEKHVFHNIVGKVQFLTSALDEHVRTLLGAAVLAWDVKEYSLFK